MLYFLQDQEDIKDSLGLKSCMNIVGNPDRKNIYYEKIDSVEHIFYPIAKGFLNDKINYPLTVIYIPLRWCGYAYKLFESLLGIKQYYPDGALDFPENRLFAHFHASQTKQMKEQIL